MLGLSRKRELLFSRLVRLLVNTAPQPNLHRRFILSRYTDEKQLDIIMEEFKVEKKCLQRVQGVVIVSWPFKAPTLKTLIANPIHIQKLYSVTWLSIRPYMKGRKC